jgi:hypothetical protein
VAAWVAAMAGYALSRRVAPPAVQTEALPVTAHAAESVQR